MWSWYWVHICTINRSAMQVSNGLYSVQQSTTRQGTNMMVTHSMWPSGPFRGVLISLGCWQGRRALQVRSRQTVFGTCRQGLHIASWLSPRRGSAPAECLPTTWPQLGDLTSDNEGVVSGCVSRGTRRPLIAVCTVWPIWRGRSIGRIT